MNDPQPEDFTAARERQQERVQLLRDGADLLREKADDIDTPTLVRLVAAWIDGEAQMLGEMESFVDLLNASISANGGPKTYLRFGRTETGNIKMHGDTTDHAAEVIRLAEVTA